MLSAVTYTYNDHRFVLRQLERLERFAHLLGEIVLVDDGSERPVDLSGCPLRRKVRLIAHGRNLGPAFAKKTGLDAVRGELILSVDCDVAFDALWLYSSLDILRDEQVGLVGARIVYENLGDSLSAALHHESLTREPEPSGFAPGGLWLLRASAYKAAGGLEGYGQKTHEDWHLSRAMAGAGLGVLVNAASDAVQSRRITRAASIRREALYLCAGYRGIIETGHPSDILRVMGGEMRDAKLVAERFACPLLVYLKTAKFLLAFASLGGPEAGEAQALQADRAFARVFGPYRTIVAAARADCALPETSGDALPANASLEGIFAYLRELAGDDLLRRIDGEALPLSLGEEAAGGYDFHFTG